MRAVPSLKSITLPRAFSTPAALDWAVGLGGLWLISGLYLDGWAHRHTQLESFFTPWHAVLYSGFAFTAAAVGLAFLNGLRLRKPWRMALPTGYLHSLLGALLFTIGGMADMTWHTLFGIEQSLEALLSPPHLFLALGGTLLITGPLRAALARSYRHNPGKRITPGLPALLSIIAVVGMLAFFTAYNNPYMEAVEPAYRGFGFQLTSGRQGQVAGGVLLQTLLLMGAALLLLRHFRLPAGALTLVFGVVTLMAVSQHDNWGMAPLGLLTGLAADGLVHFLRPGEGRDAATRLFAFLVPLVYFGLFFAALLFSGSLTWSFELWGGMVLLAGFAGWLLSYAFFQPEIREEEGRNHR